jgi:hypothetical protein
MGKNREKELKERKEKQGERERCGEFPILIGRNDTQYN